jgi:tetratricopeptide (TPR) repeat protein
MKTRVLVPAVLSAAFALAIAPEAFAAGGGGGGGGGGGMTTLTGQVSTVDPQFAAGVKAIDDGRFPDAIALLQSYLGASEAHEGDADAHNWLGYAYRRSGNYDAAFLQYDRALAINPKHRGAHEYMGEAYLLLGNLPQAEEHLKILDQLCWLPCTEYSQLKTKVAEYKSAHAQTAGAN